MRKRRYSSWSLAETLVGLSCAVMIIFPATQFLFGQLKPYAEFQVVTSIEQQSDYIFKLIESELFNSKLGPDWIPSQNNSESTILAFRRSDGKYIRYYLRGEELVKDYNYAGGNAVSPRMYRSFNVKRIDRDLAVIITVSLQDKFHYVHRQSWNITKP